MRNWFRRFMQGRYGNDKLNMTILWSGVLFCLLSMMIPVGKVRIVLSFLSYVCMFWAIFRGLSRNTYMRYEENRRYLAFLERLKDRQHRHYRCPRCRQSVRVPRGKGKIAITCPRCKEKFIKRT